MTRQKKAWSLKVIPAMGRRMILPGPKMMTPLAEILSAVLYHGDLELQQSA